MALAILTLSCLIFYSTSKFFPFQGYTLFEKYRPVMRMIASVLAIGSLLLFTLQFDFSTSLMFWMISLMTLLSSIILSLKINTKWIWFWSSLFIFFIVIDLI